MQIKQEVETRRHWGVSLALAVMVGLTAGCVGADSEADVSNVDVVAVPDSDQGNDPTNDPVEQPDDEPGEPVATGNITGTVSDTDSGMVLEGASVTAGDTSTTTDADGLYTLTGVPLGERVMVQISAPGFEDNIRIVNVAEDETATASASLLPVGTMEMVDPTAGGEVTIDGSPAAVSFGPNAISGNSMVAVSLTDVEPGNSTDNMPGDFMGTDSSGELQMIESFGALAVNIRDDAGNDVPLADGATATLRIPVSTRSSDRDPTIPLWFFDESSGVWVQEGEATLRTVDGESFYEGEVGHFTFWNADRVIDTVTITGCVRDSEGLPVAGVSVSSRGTNYTGTSRARTNSDGIFEIPVRRSSRLTLRGTVGSAVTSTRSLSTGPDNLDITDDCLLFGATNERAFSITLSWGEEPRDLDSWLLRPEGGHISYTFRGNLETEPFANLDVDDTSSFGPEVVTVLRPRVGTYRYFVDNFSERAPGITGSPARVELSANGTDRLFTPPDGETAGETNYWRVFDITIAADCSATISPATGDVWTVSPPERPVEPDSSIPFCSAPADVR